MLPVSEWLGSHKAYSFDTHIAWCRKLVTHFFHILQVDFCISEDSDLLAFGVSKVGQPGFISFVSVVCFYFITCGRIIFDIYMYNFFFTRFSSRWIGN